MSKPRLDITSYKVSNKTSSTLLGNKTSRGWKLEVTDLTTLIAAFSFVVVRLYTKFFTHSPGWEDIASILAMMIAICRTSLCSVGIRVNIKRTSPPNYYKGTYLLCL